MQKWEYLLLVRQRSFEIVKGKPWYYAGGWVNDIGDKRYDDIGKLLETLGNEGWELVSVSPRSSYAGGTTVQVNQTDDYAGFTDTELWVFKRPKA